MRLNESEELALRAMSEGKEPATDAQLRAGLRMALCEVSHVRELLELQRSSRELEAKVLEAEVTRAWARVKILEARQARAVRLLSGQEPAAGVARKDAPAEVQELPDYWDRKRSEGDQEPSTCAAELRKALDVSGPPRGWSEPQR